MSCRYCVGSETFVILEDNEFPDPKTEMVTAITLT